MGVGLDAGRDADQATRRADRACTLELVERVEHDQRALLRGAAQELVLLVVAVDHELLARDASTERELELADRRDVGAETLLGEEPEHCDRGERLGAVHDQGAGRGRAVGARLRAQRHLVVDDHGGAELGRHR